MLLHQHYGAKLSYFITKYTLLLIVISLCEALALENPSSAFAGKRIALHAQASASKHGFVSGSVYTCLGLKSALEDLGAAHVRVFETGFYGPVCLDPDADEVNDGNCSLIDHSSALEDWDVVIIEGWFDMIRSFIHLVRSPRRFEDKDSEGRVSIPRQPLVFYFCLDTYSDHHLQQILRLNVDGYLTNSEQMRHLFYRAGAPALLLHLAVDDKKLRKPLPSVDDSRYQHNVVFIGQWTEKKKELFSMLREARPYGLVVYGFGWKHTEFADVYKGVLPVGDLFKVYWHSKVAIGCTDDLQKSFGMVNNRVFEVLSTQAILITDHFAELETLFPESDQIRYYRQPGDVTRHLDAIFHAPHQACPSCGNGALVKRHTYASRARALDEFIQSTSFTHGQRNALSICVVFFKPKEIPFESFDSGFVQALRVLQEAFHYSVTWINLADYVTTRERSNALDNEPITIDLDVDALFLKNPYDVVIVKSNWYWYPDTFARTYLRDVSSRLILAISGVAPPPVLTEMEIYDALLSETKWYMQQLTAHSNVVHAFGVDTRTMVAEPNVTKRYDILGIGSIVGYKRPGRFSAKAATNPGTTNAWIGSIVDKDLAQQLKSNDIELLEPVSQAALAKVIRQARKVYISSGLEGGGERAVLEAKACGVEVEVEEDNDKLKELASLTKPWSHLYYAKQIQEAITRIMAFGRARAALSVQFPSEQLHLRATKDVSAWVMPIRKTIRDFNIGVDGFWTTHTSCFGVEYKVEIADFRVAPYVSFPVGRQTYSCRFFASLRPNVFSGIVKRTEPITVIVEGNPSLYEGLRSERAHAVCVNMSQPDCDSVLTRRNPYDKVQDVVIPEDAEPTIVDLAANPRIELILSNDAARSLWTIKETFEESATAELRIGDLLVPVRFTLWGQGSLALNNTSRRSIVANAGQGYTFSLHGILLKRVVMLSLFEDATKLAYASAISALQSISVHGQPLWKAASGLALLQVDTSSSVYLLNEHPFDTAQRYEASSSVGQRDLDDGIVEVTVGSFNARKGVVHEVYAELMEYGQMRELKQSVDVDAYLHWLAVNNILMNGDYIDEVFFCTQPSDAAPMLRLIPWDYDTIFQPCHMQGRRAIQDDVLFFCAESRLDRFIQASPPLRSQLSRVTKRLLLHHLTPTTFCNHHLRTTLDTIQHITRNATHLQLTRGFNTLCAAFEQRHRELAIGLGLLTDELHQEGKAKRSSDRLPPNPRGEAETGLAPWKPRVESGPQEVTKALVMVPASWPFEDFSPPPFMLRWYQLGAVYHDAHFTLMCERTSPQAPAKTTALRKRFGVTAAVAPCESFDVRANGRTLATVSISTEATPSWIPLCSSSDSRPTRTSWPSRSRIIVPSSGCLLDSVAVFIGPGSLVLMERGSSLLVRHASIHLNGTHETPIVVTGRSRATAWSSWSVEGDGAKIVARYTLFAHSGAGQMDYSQVGTRKTYTHRQERAAIEAYNGAAVDFHEVVLYAGLGQAFSVADAKVDMVESLVQGFVAGGEFVDSRVRLERSVFTEFPDDDLGTYADEDNDGVYITGGDVHLVHAIVGYAKDDCLDSGSGEGGFLSIQDCLFDSCQHEGVAITNRGEAPKTVFIGDSTLRNNQQGFELGWSTPRLNVVIQRSSFLHNQVGVRYGDNYQAPVEGFVHVHNCTFIGNHQNHVLRLVRGGPSLDATRLQITPAVEEISVESEGPLQRQVNSDAKEYPLSFLLDGDLVNITYREGDDLGQVSQRMCAAVNRSCSEQMYSYLYVHVRALEREESGDGSEMLSIPVDIGGKKESGSSAFVLYCNEDILMQVFHYCQSNALGYTCTKRLLQEVRTRMKQLTSLCGRSLVNGEDMSAPADEKTSNAFVESGYWGGLADTLRTSVATRFPFFTLVEHGSSCARATAVAATFAKDASVVCVGSKEIDVQGDSESVLVRCGGLSLDELFVVPDVVHVQLCLEDCGYRRDPIVLNKLFSLSFLTIIDLGADQTYDEMVTLLHDAAVVKANPLQLRSFQVADAIGMWVVETVAMERKVKHHYNALEVDGWVGSRYSVRIKDGAVEALRLRDAKRIPYRYLGYSLNTILEAGLLEGSRRKLLKDFTRLSVTEDMAPWNILFTNASGLVYVDSETRLTSNLNPNYMLTLILLRGCHHLRSTFREDPIQAFQQCMVYSVT